MAGFSNDAANNDIVFADNVDFSGGATPSRQITADGQLLIGSTASPNIKAGFITSTDGSLNVTNSSGNIDLSLSAVNNGPSGFYGDGSDGSVTFDGVSVVLGLTPSSNVYTLARDIFLDSSTINSGVSIKTNCYRIFCNGTLTNNGTIHFNGNDAVLSVAGASNQNSSSSINTSSTGTGGGASSAGTGSNGTNIATNTSFGGVGGAGGAGTLSGGAGGTILPAPSAISGSIRSLPWAIMGKLIGGQTNITNITCGSGGGGGGGDGTVAGGGGGGGAGPIILASYLIAGTGNIQCIGGKGADGGAGGTNCGGGGGGGGGLVIAVSQSVQSGSISGQTISVAGGRGGTATGTGINGSDGNPGTTILLRG